MIRWIEEEQLSCHVEEYDEGVRQKRLVVQTAAVDITTFLGLDRPDAALAAGEPGAGEPDAGAGAGAGAATRHRRMPVTPSLCTPLGFLFGGAGLAAAVQAAEDATGRPLIWASAQYLAHVHPPAVLDLEVHVAAAGMQVTQVRVSATADGAEILTVNAALGERPVEAVGQWLEAPAVPAPEACAEPLVWRTPGAGISARLDSRLARGRTLDQLDGTPGEGRTLLWMRIPDLTDLSAAALGILADHVPMGVREALGMRAGGTSLDTSLRVVRLVPTTWVLLDIRIHAVARGFAHGRLDMWSEDGTLLATAAQSASVRFWRD